MKTFFIKIQDEFGKTQNVKIQQMINQFFTDHKPFFEA